MTKYRQVLGWIARRVESGRATKGMVRDVAYALTRLKESDIVPSGRMSTLTDLQKRATEVESTHDPKRIAELIAALNAFLGEEMNEEAEKEHIMPNGSEKEKDEELPVDEEDTEATEAEEEPAEEPAEDEEDTITCEACGHQMKLTEMASRAGVPGAIGEAEEEMVDDSASTGAPPEGENDVVGTPDDSELEIVEARVRRRESAAGKGTKAAQPAADSTLRETERAELMLLRAEKRNRFERVRALKEATAAIKKANVLLEPSDLVSFPRAQWPTIMTMARNAGLHSWHGGGGGETNYQALVESDRRDAKPMTAREVFERGFSRDL